VKISPFDTVIPKLRDITRYWRTILRSGLIGTGVGIVPGVGEDVAAWSSYAAAKRASKEKEQFGKGSVEGLMAAETGDNACVPGAIIPVLTLAIPGSAPAAVLMAAMIIHGVKPGPLIMVENPQFVYDVVAMMLFATIGILIYGLVLTKALVQVLRVPQHYIVPIIFVLCAVGSFAIAGRLFDVYVMLAFGIIGFFLRSFGYPMAPLVLGIVLGDLLEKNLRRALVLSDGDLTPFFTRPISAVVAAMIFATIGYKVFSLYRKRKVPRMNLKLSLCNEVLQPCPSSSNAHWRHPRAIPAWNWLRSRWPMTPPRWTKPPPGVFAPRPMTMAWPSAACIGCWSSPRGCRWSQPTRPATADPGIAAATHRFAAACGAQVLVHGSPRTALAGRGPDRGRCACPARRRTGSTCTACRGCRRRLLPGTTLARGNTGGQHRGAGRRHRGPHRFARAAHHARRERCVAGRERTRAPGAGALSGQRSHCPCATQRPQPPRPWPGRHRPGPGPARAARRWLQRLDGRGTV
jgi:hypothetical protein